jgi:hypothetical protein
MRSVFAFDGMPSICKIKAEHSCHANQKGKTMIQLHPREDFYKAPSYQHYQQNSKIAGE